LCRELLARLSTTVTWLLARTLKGAGLYYVALAL
jgi:hypothetical protein